MIISRASLLRALALILVLATLLSVIFVPALALTDSMLDADSQDGVDSATDGAQSKAPSVEITEGGYKVGDITLREDERVTLTAECENAEGTVLQWQILDPSDATRWISIRGADKEELPLTYALVGSMLNERSETTVRCTLRRGTTLVSSEPVKVTVSYNVDGYTFLSSMRSESFADPSSYPVRALAEENTEGESGTQSGGDDTEHETFTIVINYIFGDGTMAFEPYGATVAKGSSFEETVKSPDIKGYSPYRRTGADYLPAPEVSFDLSNIQANHTVNVIYEPALVKFQVHHHFQNILNDDYSADPDKITTSYALTGSIVPDGLALTYAELPGFRSLPYEKLTVAADGSTVIEIRYDRNYYLVDFEMNGGYGTEPVYVKYGSDVGANVPIRHGYVFDGWELVSYGGEAPTNEQASTYDITSTVIKVPDANLKYRARWITEQTTYTLVFWRENANDDGYSYWGYLPDVSAMSGSMVSGTDRADEVEGITDYEYFTFNPSRTDKNILVEGDGSTVVNVYYTRNRYKITFKANATCAIPEGHRHTDDCYISICVGGHIHTDECDPELTCLIPEHTAHTDSCVRCGLSEHTHGSDCCPLAEHTHSLSCFNNIGNLYTGNTRNFPTNVPNGHVYRHNYLYYIYINGSWYRYSGWGVSNGDVIDPRCGYTEHEHGDACCNLTEHNHTDTCFRDVIHIHEGETCYTYSCGQVEHEHTSECQILTCGVEEGHSHSTSCNRSNSLNTVKVVYRKYQQSLEDLWPVTTDHATPIVYNSGERWSPSGTSYFSNVLVYIANMIPDDFTLELSAGTASPKTMNYYLEVLPGQEYTHTYTYGGVTRYYVLKTSIQAKYNYVTESEDFFNITGYDTYISNPTFPSNGQITASVVNFYYTRIVTQDLTFSNKGEVVREETGIMYGQSLESFGSYVPEYPETLEPGAFNFVGWYTSPGCFDGTEVDWANMTMPESDIMLYARWDPVIHTVKVFKTAELAEQIGSTQKVSHNNFAAAPDGVVENGEYVFLGWFYMDGTEEKAFVFNSIPVSEDLNIYAKWSSHVSVDYEVHYVLEGTTTPIADPLIGTAIAGNNKTFYAKAGTELYEGYREGYYPVTSSHTVTMGLNTEHKFYFEYIYVESMPYTVRYVDEHGTDILPSKTIMDNRLAVVTETFVRVDKMMPDAYQKRLVLVAGSTDENGDGVGDENVITFTYNRDEEHAYYRVVHYIANIGAEGYREYRTEDTVGKIGLTYTVDPLTLTGFSFNGNKTVVNGVSTPSVGSVSVVLTGDGAKIELYYDRQNVTYTVEYVDGNGNALKPTKTGSGIYGEQIAEIAQDLTKQGYTLVSESVKSITLSSITEHNRITFEYQESTCNIKYQVADGVGGVLSLESENVDAITGVPTGSTPTAESGYRFVGWFLDFTCTVPADASMIDASTGKFKPTKADDAVWASQSIFYAKFEPEFVDLTVTSKGAHADDAYQAFIFRIRGRSGTDTEGVDLTVIIIGNDSVTVKGLRVGTYTVEELTDWSWRYTPDQGSRTVTLSIDTSANFAVFDHSRTSDAWLDASASSVKVIEDPS